MKSYRIDELGSLDGLRPHEDDVPRIGRGQVLVRVRASSLNFRDLMIVRGLYPFGPVTGRIAGSDGAGEIEAVGEGVTRFKVGDRVISNFFPNWIGGPLPANLEHHQIQHEGYLTEYRAIDAELLAAMPDHLTFEEASTLPCAALTAWSALSGVEPGDTVLTLGTGGVSIFAVQLAKAFGARVIATTSSTDKFEKLKALGADDLIDYKDTPEWHQAVRDLTDGRGVDRIVEVGGPATIARSIKAVAQGGQVSLVGMLGGMEGGEIDIMQLFFSQATYRPIAVGSRSDLEAMNRTIANRKIKPVIDRVFAFDEVPAALQHLDGRNVFGKVVIRH